jgi:dihydrofolate synthase/folylpolyglutamate synthase
MIGVLEDKDYKSILKIMAPLADTIITLTPENHRALASDKLANEARLYCERVFDCGNIEQALEMAYAEAKADNIILAFGSLSFLGSLVKILRMRKEKTYNKN